MALLTRVLAAATLLAGCYSPDLRDCTVSCESSADCAGAQVCSNDHFCAAQGMTCAGVSATGDAAIDPGDGAVHSDAAGPHDAGTSHDARPLDARPIDAPPPPIDAPPPPHVALHLHVDGNGQLSFDSSACSSDCTYQVQVGVSITVLATAGNNQHLDKWTAGPCAGSHQLVCTFTPVVPTFAAAKFKGGD